MTKCLPLPKPLRVVSDCSICGKPTISYVKNYPCQNCRDMIFRIKYTLTERQRESLMSHLGYVKVEEAA